MAQSKGEAKEGPRPRPKSSLSAKSIFVALVKVGVFSGVAVAALFLFLVIFLPLPQAQVPQATRIYDINGNTISSLFVENRVVLPSSDIPQSLKNAVVAVEDKRFYQHHGIDIESIMRALWTDIQAGKIVEGGSTITNQLAKNLYLTPERTIQRKFIEAVYTIKLEMRYSKDEILTMYLNQIYLGHGTYGCEVASRLYFGKSAKDLTLPEAALLAGIIRSPENYSPYNDLELSIQRRNLVLDLMAQQGYITQAQADAAKKADVKLAGLPKSTGQYFVDYVVSQIKSSLPDVAANLYRGGYQIYTTLDLNMQKAAEAAFARYMPKGQKDSKGITQPQGALVAIDPSNGYIKALIGGRDWSETQLNRAYQVRRQPGSAFKIFLYTAVIDKGHPITETKMCEPVEYPGRTSGEKYVPRDFGSQPYHYAPLNIRQAIAISDNVVATRWISEIGPSTVAQYARLMGIKSPLDQSIPLALGASEVSPLEMAVGAATLSAGGIRPEPLAILKIVDAKGNVIMENRPKRTAVLDPGTAYIMTSLLKSVLGPGGTGEGLAGFLGGRPAAGKTGTTDGYREAWFVGYTKELACAVYVGWDNREKALSGTGGTVAGPIWASFISQSLKNQPFRDWTPPDNVVWAKVCDQSGCLAGPLCPSAHYEVFRKDAMPPQCTTNHLLQYLFPGSKNNQTPSTPGTSGQGSGQTDQGQQSSESKAPTIVPQEAPSETPGNSQTAPGNSGTGPSSTPSTAPDDQSQPSAPASSQETPSPQPGT